MRIGVPPNDGQNADAPQPVQGAEISGVAEGLILDGGVFHRPRNHLASLEVSREREAGLLARSRLRKSPQRLDTFDNRLLRNSPYLHCPAAVPENTLNN